MRSTRAVPLAAPVGDNAVRRLLRRNLGAVSGLGLLALSAAIAASLATWTVDDPSLSHATDHEPRNALGLPGAMVADIIMQFFGLAAIALLLPPVVWAWRLVFGRTSSFGWRTFATWVGATLLAALALAALPVMGTWPLPTGFGGVSGDLLLRIPALFLGGTPTGTAAAVISGVAALVAVLLLVRACGFGRRARAVAPAEADDEDEPVVVTRGRTGRVAPPVHDDLGDEDDGDDAAPGFDDAEDDRPGRAALIHGAVTHGLLSSIAMLRRSLGGRGRDGGGRIAGGPPDEDWIYDEAPPPRRPRVEPRLYEDDGEARSDAGSAYAPPVAEEGDGDLQAWYEDQIEEQLAPVTAAPPPPPAPSKRVAAPAPRPKTGKKTSRSPAKAPVQFELPPLELLAEPKPSERRSLISPATLEQNARNLEGVLDDFGVRGEIINVRPGPVVTLYELEPAPGIKSARVIGLADDIARSMSAIACRVAVIPGKNAIGIELPNVRRETVYLRELLAAEDFVSTKARLGIALGKTIGGEPVIADLARMPHLLVAGTTGSGKSVSINTMILSLLYRLTPQECRMIMIDPKMLELSIYDGIPHLLTPVVTDPKQAVVALKWTVREMEDRYRKMSKLGVRNIDGYNQRVAQADAKGEMLSRTVQTGFDPDTGEAVYEREELSFAPMPFIVVIIDEMADLMMVAGKDIEGAVQRLAQMARAAGIHVVMATQRPSVDVITGTIKANFPTRISFQVTSKIDSRTILGEQGAEQLLGQGDMLFMAGGGRIQRVHGPFVSDHEVEDIVRYLKEQGTPEYLDSITVDEDEVDAETYEEGGGDGEGAELYDKAVAIVLRDRKVSTSYIQRRLSIGYNRAASIIERMEKEGVVGAANHAGKRTILVGDGVD
jgi:S-DNA-T family DNA segregation ATPase FtsK/SpoIIIE